MKGSNIILQQPLIPAVSQKAMKWYEEKFHVPSILYVQVVNHTIDQLASTQKFALAWCLGLFNKFISVNDAPWRRAQKVLKLYIEGTE